MKYIIVALAIQLLSSPAFAAWKAVELAGDNSIRVFDNARLKVAEILEARGVEDIRHLSANRTMQRDGVLASSAANLEKALQSLDLAEDDKCLVFLTSHGSPSGFYIAGQPTLAPSTLGGILSRTCGDRTTVLIVSACYSGVMIDAKTVGPNRVILTAARRDRTSFGCSAEEEFVYYDTCVIALLPKADTWKGLYADIQQCITAKEGRFKPSLPQAYFGENVGDLEVDFTK